jgi:phenylpropionate dioxygenase-like ring-hydroxylating dioxygenase large terminal subunit
MRRHVNQSSQPFREMPVFQNWDVVARAWYYACPAREIPAGSAKSLNLCGQHVVIFRSEDGRRLHAMDGFCPHMGTDLGIGTVRGDRLACFFHHWEFDGAGQCRHIPCGEEAPANAKLRTYAVEEHFGAIWIFPAEQADFPMPQWDGFDSASDTLRVAFDKPYRRTCHHHVTMINGIDAQHLRTVHGFDIAMQLNVEDNSDDPGKGTIDFTLSGDLPAGKLSERIVHKLSGGSYAYSMRYSGGSIGLLTILQRVRLFGRWTIPPLHMIFAYRPLEFGDTLVQPIFATPKRGGLFGGLIEHVLLWLTRRAFRILQDEDGKVYDNMRFNPVALIGIDQPVKQFINTINQLTPSDWSGAWQKTPPSHSSSSPK